MLLSLSAEKKNSNIKELQGIKPYINKDTVAYVSDICCNSGNL